MSYENATSGDWHLELRHRLRELYARAPRHPRPHAHDAGDYAGAAEIYERLVALDDLDEEAAKNLIAAFEKQGDRGAATRAYRRLAEALKRELGEEPSF